MTQGLLFFLPVLAIGAALLARRYPGEGVVLKLRERGRQPSAHRHPDAPPRLPLRTRAVTCARGGELLARSLAVRPPPRAVIAAG